MSKSIIQQKRILTKAGGGSSLATPVSVANGGTGISSYTIGDLIIASGATTLLKLASPAIGQFLLSGGVGAAPDYSGTNLTFEKATSTFSIKTTAGDEWFFVEPTNNTIALGDIDSSGNGSRLVIDNTNQKITWNKSIFGIGGVEYTFPAANASGVLTNNGSGTLSWAAASSGLTFGTSTATNATAGDIAAVFSGTTLNSTTATVNRQFRVDVGTPFNSFLAYGSMQSGSYNNATALNNSAFGYNSLFSLTTGYDNTAMGSNAMYYVAAGVKNTAYGSLSLAGTGDENTAIGYYSQGNTGAGAKNTSVGTRSLYLKSTGNNNTALGYEAGYNYTTNSMSIAIGYQAGYATPVIAAGSGGTIAIGYFASPLTANTSVYGSNQPEGYVSDLYYNGVTSATGGGNVYGINIRGCGGSGANINGADLSFYAGLPTGDGSSTAAGRHGYISFWTGDVGAGGSTLRSATEKARLVQGGDLVLGITSDTKGLVLKASDGHYWRITMSTLGVLTTADLGTSIPT